MKIAAIDMGTNSFLCLVAEVSGESIVVLQDSLKVVRLGENVQATGRFAPAALARARSALQDFSKLLQKHGPIKIIATATSAARDVINSSELFDICQNLNIPLHIISGDREAELSFKGAVSQMPDWKDQNLLVIDVGGGSTELIFSDHGQAIKSESFNVGCVRLTEMFLKADPVDLDELALLESHVTKTIKSYVAAKPDRAIAVAGTPVTLACIDKKISYDEAQVEASVLSLDQIRNLKLSLAKMKLEERKKLIGLDPLRADVIVAGAAILDCIMVHFQIQKLVVSTRGLRFGVALSHWDFNA